MSDKMTLVVVKQTQHVLGVVTLTAEDAVAISGGVLVRPPTPPTPAGPLATSSEPFEIPADQLESVPVDLDLAVLLEPLGYIVKDNTASKPVATLQPLSLASDKVVVKVAGGTLTDPAKVWVQVAGGALTSPVVAVGTIAKDTDTIELPLQNLQKGEYLVVATVERHQILVEEITI